MKIKTLLPVAFGKFHAKEPITLGDGINLILGQNEQGKSTLGAFILGMFYGFKKEGRTKTSRTPEFERYRPWSGKDYRGVITYEHEGRVYRVERSFDPDAVRILDDLTGEDITRTFTQDTRREWDFARRHLGLSQHEFVNTVWIGQLKSKPDADVADEIRSRLEAIVDGSSVDHSLSRALAALANESSKIKGARSYKAKLDVVRARISELEEELSRAVAREESLRFWSKELSSLSDKHGEVEKELLELEKEQKILRYSLLVSIREQAGAINQELSLLQAERESLEWAKEFDMDLANELSELEKEMELVESRLSDLEREKDRLEEKIARVSEALVPFSPVMESGLEEAEVFSLYSRYLSARANTARGERLANEARKELRKVEEEGSQKGLDLERTNEAAVKQAEALQEVVSSAERQRDQLNVELEKARSQVYQQNPSGAAWYLYMAALVSLGAAIVLTVLGLPLGIPAFAAAILVFCAGYVRYRKVARVRAEGMKLVKEKEQECLVQAKRIEDARNSLSVYLARFGARSVEELRLRAREAYEFQEKLKNAREKYQLAHNYWFEASSELSSVEKELCSKLKAAGYLSGSEVPDDAVMNRLKKDLSRVRELSLELESAQTKLAEVSATLERQQEAKSELLGRRLSVLGRAGVDNADKFWEKAQAAMGYSEIQRDIRALEGRLQALLSGKDLSSVEAEMSSLRREIGDMRVPEATENEYELVRNKADLKRRNLSEIKSRMQALASSIKVKAEEGRDVAAVEEELRIERELEECLTLDKEALDLAYEVLNSISAATHRDFAPKLNARVGEVLGTITQGRYPRVKVSPSLDMTVVHPDSLVETPVAALSGGTLDQCYFALRVAVAELVTGRKDFPLFLDDSFVQYDDERLKGALEILASLALSHQILLFSCHGREKEYLDSLGIQYTQVSLP